jgi:hypothetical protein
MRTHTVLKVTVPIILVALFLLSTVKFDKNQTYNISIDIATPLSIVWPCEIAIIGDEGERGLRIAPKIGRGWLGEAGGEATYSFYVPADGTYYIWGYALWYDACSNAIFVKIDDMEKAILGNDPIYNKWHWTKGFSVELKKGTHNLHLSNHSDNIALQKVFLAGSDVTKPDEAETIFSDIFYDGFDGCDYGNFAQWQQVYGKWQVYDPFRKVNSYNNALVGDSEGDALITIGDMKWSDYSINLSVQSIELDKPEAFVGICFGVKGKDDYYLLKWSYSEVEKKANVSLIKTTEQRDELLKDFQFPWKDNCWYDIQIDLVNGQIQVHIDNEKPVLIPITTKIAGGIGLYLKGKTTAYFDNIHVRQFEN